MLKVSGQVRRIRHKPGLLNRVMRSVSGPSRVKVGLPSGSDGGVMDRAFYNEFGTVHIPERPAMREGLEDAKNDLRPQMRKAAKGIITGRETMRGTLGKFGIVGQRAMQESITAFATPPNAPGTVAQKGSSNPLIDSGEYRGAITWKVDE